MGARRFLFGKKVNVDIVCIKGGFMPPFVLAAYFSAAAVVYILVIFLKVC